MKAISPPTGCKDAIRLKRLGSQPQYRGPWGSYFFSGSPFWAVHYCPFTMPTFAAVDIGSNSVRLKIARLTRHRLTEIDEDREVTRLGDSVFRNSFLSPEAIATTVKVLRRFHRAVQNAGAD